VLLFTQIIFPLNNSYKYFPTDSIYLANPSVQWNIKTNKVKHRIKSYLI